MIHLIAIIFPFSMVAGGVHSTADWQQHRSDPAYRICRISGTLRPAQVRKPIQRYVSFSRDGMALWTDHPLTITAREQVMVSNGEIVLRGRCGNCLQSEAPPARLRVPFVPPDAPIEAATVAVDLPPYLTDTPGKMPRFEFAPPQFIPPPAPVTPIVPPDRIPVVPAAFVPYGVPVGRSHRPVPVAAAPEPGTCALMIAGLALLIRRKRT